MFNFEKLQVWNMAIEFANGIRKQTLGFPQMEMFALGQQLRRAAYSIPSNIAEGSTRTSKQDQRRFYEIAYGSLMEVITQLKIAHLAGYLTDEQFQADYDNASQIARMLSTLRSSTQT